MKLAHSDIESVARTVNAKRNLIVITEKHITKLTKMKTQESKSSSNDTEDP